MKQESESVLELCHQCMLKNGYKRKDQGAHTATLKDCPSCGERKPILSNRHWVVGDKDKKTPQ